MRATDGGARLSLQIEIKTDTGTEKMLLSPMVARLDALPQIGALREDELAYYLAESRFADALTKAYRYLSASNISPFALVRKLRAFGVEQKLAQRVVEELIAEGVLDEGKSAVCEAEKCLAKLWGNRRILAALREKGYSRSALSRVQELLSESDSVARCIRLIEKRRMPLPQDEQSAARFAAALVRYGYTGGEIKAAVTRLNFA